MPISADPNATTKICLKVDEDKPLEARPMLVCRYLTRRQVAEVDRLTTEANKTKKDKECFALLMQAWRVGIVGWVNFNDEQGNPRPFDEENISAELSDAEVWEIAVNYPARISREEWRSKKAAAIASDPTSDSRSQLPTPTAESAPAAPADANSTLA